MCDHDKVLSGYKTMVWIAKRDIELNLRPVRMTTDILKVKSATLTAAMSADP
uniref:Uncharacterized protein n=1 Tax=Amphimedon queenslandica TaxID=400682 RepID=A0A1X7SPX3_AMPQE